MAERDSNTLYSKFMERLHSGESMTRAGVFMGGENDDPNQPAYKNMMTPSEFNPSNPSGFSPIRIERQADDSPIQSAAKQGARGLVTAGENMGSFADSFVNSAKERAGEVVDAVKYPFTPPSTAPLMPGNLPKSMDEPAPAMENLPAKNEQTPQPEPLTPEQQKIAADAAATEWEGRVKKAPSGQKKKAVEILEKEGVDVEEKFKTVAPEMGRFGLTKEEQGWFLMEFGLRLMAEGGKPGATVGSSFGKAGADTMGSVKLHKKEKKQGLAAKAAAAEDARRWESEQSLERAKLLVDAGKGNFSLGSKLTSEGYLPRINKNTGETEFVTGKDGKPVKFESQSEVNTILKEAGLVTDLLEADINYSTSSDPEENAASVNKAVGAFNQVKGALGGGVAKNHLSNGAVDELPPANSVQPGQGFTNQETGEVFVSDGNKWVVSKTK